MESKSSYKASGVDREAAEAAKQEMAASLQTGDRRVLNQIGPFASLFDASFPGYDQPVLVLKMEEPGSKQKLAFLQGRVSSLCFDLIHHLVNDIIVMGATPLAVQDVILCGKLEKPVVTEIVASLARACREQECTLTGGETSEQPGVVEAGTYLLAASIVGVVERSKVIDGSPIREGDLVMGVASNGLHTNGYSLVRALLARQPSLAEQLVDGEPFMEVILRPHLCYYHAVRGLFDLPALHGMAHITGGGIAGNLNRILPDALDARIDRGRIRVPTVFRVIQDAGRIEDDEMLATFNMGVGLTLVVEPAAAAGVQAHLARHGCESAVIGEIIPGEKRVVYHGALRW
jgi:phosphoribosylformylglycinamidine cyclo-ligase